MADGAGSLAMQPKWLPLDGEISSRHFDVVSYFSGCGGLDLGFSGGFKYLDQYYPQTNFKILAAYDSDPKAVECYKANVGAHVALADLANVDPKDVPHGRVLIGGFPCQEFSHCGPRKGLDSERGRLYLAMVRYAEWHRPDVVIAENVAGLKYLDGGRALAKIEQDFVAVGYRLKAWEVHAQNYGVPQARHRLILAFFRSDLDSSLVGEIPQVSRKLSAKDAISDLLRRGRSAVPNQMQYFKAARAKNGHGQGDEKTRADGPAYTVRANSRSRVQFHYSRPRRLTVRECARLQTFPDTFIFPFDATSNMRLIGNAVPPVLGYRIAKTLEEFLVRAAN